MWEQSSRAIAGCSRTRCRNLAVAVRATLAGNPAAGSGCLGELAPEDDVRVNTLAAASTALAIEKDFGASTTFFLGLRRRKGKRMTSASPGDGTQSPASIAVQRLISIAPLRLLPPRQYRTCTRATVVARMFRRSGTPRSAGPVVRDLGDPPSGSAATAGARASPGSRA